MNGFLSSAVKIGKPFRNSTRSRLLLFVRYSAVGVLAKKVGAIEAQQIVVQTARWDKVGKLKLATIGLDAFTQHMQCATARSSLAGAARTVFWHRPRVAS